ncbi:hypothetical protein [Pseudotenacibaculum haliotis]
MVSTESSRVFNKRYWYAKKDKICFTFSNITEGDLCTGYILKGDNLNVKAFGEIIKYKRKK